MDKEKAKAHLERKLEAATNLSDYALCVMAILELEDRLDLEDDTPLARYRPVVDFTSPEVQEFVRGTTPIDPEGLEDIEESPHYSEPSPRTAQE